MNAEFGIMNRSIILLFIALLCGCTIPNAEQKESFIQSMNKWVGRSADDLVAINGAPANVYQQVSGGRVFEYIRVLSLSDSEIAGLHYYLRFHRQAQNRNLYVPDTRATTKSGGLGKYVLGTGKTCKLLFDVSAGNVVNSWTIDEGTCY